jgi:Flp pilus assembly protein TadD
MARRAFFPANFPASIGFDFRSGGVASGSVGFVIFCRSGVLLIAVLALMLQLPLAARAATRNAAVDEQVCDPLADYFLGMEDYSEAIARHQIVIRQKPDNALAHYHLGFAYGETGQHRKELAEYQKAISLGLDDWQLFLNLGLLYLENGQVRDASSVLKLATLLGPDQPETHFNLALAYERLGLLPEAEQEDLLSLQIDPSQPDARNTLGAIYAEEGDYTRASQEWTELVDSNPDYMPARTNLTILRRVEQNDSQGAPAGSSFSHIP